MSKYGDEYTSFIVACKGLVARRSRKLAQCNTETLQKAAETICTRLKKPDAINAVERGFEALDEEVREAFYLELQYVNANLTEDVDGSERNVDDAKTAKDSLEDLLGSWLPDWMKKSLKVLNEVLSLAR